MSILLRFVLFFVGLIGSYVGSLSFNENNGVDFAIGGMGLLIAVVCFFFLAKGLWRILGCMSTFIIVAVIVGIIFYFVSGSNLLHKFLNKDEAAPAANVQQQAPVPGAPMQQQAPAQQSGLNGMVGQIAPMLHAMGGGAQQAQAPQNVQQMPPQPMMQPVIKGAVNSIASGDQFRIGNQWISLFGIDAPEIQQTCTDDHGRAYNCGYTVARKLKDLLGNDEVTCNIMSVSSTGAVTATCSIGPYDLGAAMVEAGWAVALRNVTPVYVPYEESARQKQIGLWAGQFYMPWEWVSQQKKMAEERQNVKIPDPPPAPKKKGKSIFDVF